MPLKVKGSWEGLIIRFVLMPNDFMERLGKLGPSLNWIMPRSQERFGSWVSQQSLFKRQEE